MINIFKLAKHKYKMWRSISYRTHYWGKIAIDAMIKEMGKGK